MDELARTRYENRPRPQVAPGPSWSDIFSVIPSQAVAQNDPNRVAVDPGRQAAEAAQQRAAPPAAMVSNRQGSDYMFDNQGPLSRVAPAARVQAPEGPAANVRVMQPEMNLAEAKLRASMVPKPTTVGELAAREIFNYAQDIAKKIPTEKDPKVRANMQKEVQTLYMGIYKPQAIAPTMLYGQRDD